MSQCRSCGAEVIWIRTVTGQPMPVDVQPCPQGTVRLLRPGIGEVLRVDERADHDGPLYRAHFATCPHAGSWRKNRSKERS